MTTPKAAPDLDTSLLPVYQQWKPAEGELSLWNYLNMRAEFDLAAAFSKLFWPDFIEVSGCVLLAEQYALTNFNEWWESLQGNRQRVEAFINHVHIWNLFMNCGPGVEYDLRLHEYLAGILTVCWKHAVQEAFPDKQFTFEYATDPDEYGPTITFFQAG